MSSTWINKVGNALHKVIVEAFHDIWKLRCNEVKTQHILFKDRLRLFPHPRPLHAMTEDDYIAFAKNWQTVHGAGAVPLQPTSHVVSRPSPRQPVTANPSHFSGPNTIMRSQLPPSNPPSSPATPVSVTNYPPHPTILHQEI
jgi:hypothetical protein